MPPPQTTDMTNNDPPCAGECKDCGNCWDKQPNDAPVNVCDMECGDCETCMADVYDQGEMPCMEECSPCKGCWDNADPNGSMDVCDQVCSPCEMCHCDQAAEDCGKCMEADMGECGMCDFAMSDHCLPEDDGFLPDNTMATANGPAYLLIKQI